MRTETTLGNSGRRSDPRVGSRLLTALRLSALLQVTALQLTACREPGASTANDGRPPATTADASGPSSSPRDGGGASTSGDGGDAARTVDAATPTSPSRDSGPTNERPSEIHDAAPAWSADAQRPDGGLDAAKPDARASAAQCEVDACNNAGTCIVRDWWTECDCDPASLPPCEYPRFRVLGQSRTDYERTMYLISGDGHVVAGSHGFDPTLREPVGVTWTLEDGLVMLEQDPAGPTLPTGINEDGSLISGRIERSGSHDIEVLWRDGVLERVSPDAGTEQVAGPRPISIPSDGSAASRTFFAFDSTDDRRLAVGRAARSDNSATEAAFWTAESGVVFLADYLEDHGVEVRRWDLWHVNAVSDDGNTMMGLGIGPDVGYRWYLQFEAPAR